MTEAAVKRRVLKWVLNRRGETFIGPGAVVAGELQSGHAVLWTLEDDVLDAFDAELPADGEPVALGGRWVRTFRTGVPVPDGATHLISVGEGDRIRHVFEVAQPRGQEPPS